MNMYTANSKQTFNFCGYSNCIYIYLKYLSCNSSKHLRPLLSSTAPFFKVKVQEGAGWGGVWVPAWRQLIGWWGAGWCGGGVPADVS